MATTYRTKESRFWFARYTIAGKRVSRSTKKESRRDAKRIAADFESEARKAELAKNDPEVPKMIGRTVQQAALELQQGTLTVQRAEELIRQMQQAARPEDPGVNFKRYSGAWLDSKEADCALQTWRSYRDAIRASCAILGAKAEQPLRNITVADVEEVKRELSKTRRGKTVNYYVSTVRRIFQSAVVDDLIVKNPAQPITAAPTGDSRKREAFTADEVRRLLAAAPTPEWHGLILLAATTGLRCGDLRNLTADNIVGTVLQIQTSKGRKKSGDILNIPLRPEALEWLEGRTGDLFPAVKATKDGTVPTVFTRVMRDAMVPNRIVLAAGAQPVIATRSFHSLRHTFTSFLANSDVPEDVRQKLTGHRDKAVHARYSHHDEALVRAIAALPKL